MTELTRLRLQTNHPKGLVLTRLVLPNNVETRYSMRIQEEDTLTFKLLRDYGITNWQDIPTISGLCWIEKTLQMYGARACDENINTTGR